MSEGEVSKGSILNQASLEAVIALRHELHKFPELSMQEQETARRLKNFLCEYTNAKIIEQGGWFYAIIPGKDHSKKIAFRADMDALPMDEGLGLPYASVNKGVSHKCGHDGHSAVLCGLAMALTEYEPACDVYLIFQHGEEIGAGARKCCKILKQEGISEIYAFHNLSGYPQGTVVYRRGQTQPASEGIRFRFQGKPSHASEPEKGKNPAQLISRMVLYAGEMAGAGVEVSDPASEELALCTVTGVRVGTGDFGISPGEGELCVTLRAEREECLKEMEEGLIRFAREEVLQEDRCLQTGKTEADTDNSFRHNEVKKSAFYTDTSSYESGSGFSMSYSIHDAFPETRNHDACLKRVIYAAQEAGIDVCEMQEMWRASEDFGWYLKECPGAMIYIGNGEGYPALHTSKYDFNDRIIETAVTLFAELCKS